MKLEHKPVNFEDARGTIRDIFVRSPKDCVTIITSAKGAVRGNHYHKQSTQYDYVVTGRLTVLTQKPGETKIERVVLNPGDLMMHEPGEVHTLIADEETIFLAFAEGLRQGEDYEKDTFRIEVPLQEQIKTQDAAGAAS